VSGLLLCECHYTAHSYVSITYVQGSGRRRRTVQRPGRMIRNLRNGCFWVIVDGSRGGRHQAGAFCARLPSLRDACQNHGHDYNAADIPAGTVGHGEKKANGGLLSRLAATRLKVEGEEASSSSAASRPHGRTWPDYSESAV